ncbi:hypothetical protein NC652_021617 [Populus alba x Populus x berolinensis]|nr:hypothetical protein NC652_021617 [Populus alba x Populus x berolinensis]
MVLACSAAAMETVLRVLTMKLLRIKLTEKSRGGHQDRMFSRNGDVECPLLNGLLVQDRMPG